MSHLKKSSLNKNVKQNSVDSKITGYPSSNPFDSDDELDNNTSLKPPKRTSEPEVNTPNLSANPLDDTGEKQISSSWHSLSSAARSKYRNDFHDSGGLENQSVQELENYAVYKAKETTNAVNNSLKIAEDIREDATKTLVNLHHQGEQITRTHATAADIDHDLSRSEKLLGSLGGLFSKTWKPKRTSPITGPVITRDDPAFRRGNHLEQRERLGLSSTSNGQSNTRISPPEPTNALQKVEANRSSDTRSEGCGSAKYSCIRCQSTGMTFAWEVEAACMSGLL
ncbi:soluble N-ethylmaleimide-sensitive factor adaptor protein 33 [Actinidia rufa]|uniref:Soluble N-ethylmaleimide-sensitive factor adaptor protein 33 n=1 Tax=Actinidia rufa TaxID=165716 RepID=A0A7J0GMU5_9ERIC|nr:soluble N-ethylmaleimide-sensitive factor adaptor protein 33 [Actinidia rufa]